MPGVKGIKPGSAEYCIEGQDGKKVRAVKDPSAEQKEYFEPGEMKLYLVVPLAVGKDVILVRSADNEGVAAGVARLLELAPPGK